MARAAKDFEQQLEHANHDKKLKEKEVEKLSEDIRRLETLVQEKEDGR